MVMEQMPVVVVMLTKVEENGKVSSLCVHSNNNYLSLCISSTIEPHAMLPRLNIALLQYVTLVIIKTYS